MDHADEFLTLAYGRALRNLSDGEVIEFYAAAGGALSDDLRALCRRELQRRQLIN
jgi:hypothetical protein